MSKMVDMARTKAEIKARDKEHSKPMASEGDYPYGLSVDLDHTMLEKLGIKTLPKVGDKLHLHAHAHVKSVSEDHRDGGKKSRRVELQLRKMMLESSKPSPEGEVEDSNFKGAKAAMDRALEK